MRLLDYLFGLVALLGLVVTGWNAVYQSPNTPVNLQARLEANANAALKAAGYNWANVEMHGQRAVLKGKAPSADAIKAAADVIITSSGKGGVIMGGVTLVENGVDAAPPVTPYVWRATKMTDGGFVLTGHVPSHTIRADIVETAQAHADGAPVEDRMVLAAGAPGANWQGMAQLAVNSLAALETGEARLYGTLLRVRGVSADETVRVRVSEDVASVTAPYQGEWLIQEPPQWKAALQGNTLILSGNVASKEGRDGILEVARQHFAGEVQDTMNLGGLNLPGWVASAELGLAHFAGFGHGEMAFVPGETGFSFAGEAPASVLLALQQDMAGQGSPFPTTLFVNTPEVDVPEMEGIDFTVDPAANCQKTLDAVMASNPLEFVESQPVISRESGDTLDKLIRVLGACRRDLGVDLIGYPAPEDSRTQGAMQSEARASELRNFVVLTGINSHRLTVIGYGPDQAVQSNDSGEGPVKNRWIEFRVRERSE